MWKTGEDIEHLLRMIKWADEGGKTLTLTCANAQDGLYDKLSTQESNSNTES